MKRLPFTSRVEVPAAIAAARHELTVHGVLLVPTETFYGLAADPASAAGWS